MSIRSGQVVDITKNIIGGDLRSEFSVVEHFLMSETRGGWENWLQVEFARNFLLKPENEGKYQFGREEIYKGITRRCDLIFQGIINGETRGTMIWVELKTQTNIKNTDALYRYEKDIIKIKILSLDFKRTNILVAFVVFKIQDKDPIIMNRLRLNHNSHYLLYNEKEWLDITDEVADPKKIKRQYIGRIVIGYFNIDKKI